MFSTINSVKRETITQSGETMKRFKIVARGRVYKFDTLEAASKVANDYCRRTGIVVAIVACK